MTREIGVLDEAIAAAEKRNDSLQHAYRAVAFERLHRVYQRDRTSRSAISAVLWGAYGLLFWGLALSIPGSTPGTFIALAATASSFLSLRAWARWVNGTRVLEARANEGYVKALVDARQRFINATAALPEIADAPQATAIMLAKIKRVKPETWRFVLWLIPLGGVAILLATLTSEIVEAHRRGFVVATQVFATLAVGILGTGLWNDLQPTRKWLGAILGPRWKTPFFWMFLLAIMAALWLAFGAMAQALAAEATDTGSAWGWTFVVATIVLFDCWMIVGMVLRQRRRRIARTAGQDSPVGGGAA